MIVSAHIEFQTLELLHIGQATQTSILFETDTLASAVPQVRMWWMNRHETLPNHFYRLCAVNLYEKVIQRIGPSGYLPPDTRMCFHEWKCDYPFPFGERLR